MSLKDRIIQRLNEEKQPISQRKVVEVVFALLKKQYPKAKLHIYSDDDEATMGEVTGWGDWSEDEKMNRERGNKYTTYVQLSRDSVDDITDIVYKANKKYTDYKISWAKFGFDSERINIEVEPKNKK